MHQSSVLLFWNIILISGDQMRPKFLSFPQKPTTAYTGTNISLEWRYLISSGYAVNYISFGIWGSPGHLTKKLIYITPGRSPEIKEGFEEKVAWSGNLSSSRAAFVLNSVNKQDGESYGIHIELGLQYNALTDWFNLLVQVPQVPKITKVTHGLQLIAEGSDVVLECEAEGKPPPLVTWFQDHTVLNRGTRSASDTVRGVSSDDNGTFVCVATNLAGSDRSLPVTIQVKEVKSYPVSPTILNQDKVVRVRNWVLRWTPGASNERAPVLQYTVWYRALQVANATIQWRQPWMTRNETRTKCVMELKDQWWYEFTVTAWNKWGEGAFDENKIKIIHVDLEEVYPASDLGEGPTIKKPTGISVSMSEKSPPNVSTISLETSVLVMVIAGVVLIVTLIAFMLRFKQKKKLRTTHIPRQQENDVSENTETVSIHAETNGSERMNLSPTFEATELSQPAGNPCSVGPSQWSTQSPVSPLLSFSSGPDSTAESASQAHEEQHYPQQEYGFSLASEYPGKAALAAGLGCLDGNGYLRPVDDFVVKARSEVVQPERGLPGDTDRTRDLLEHEASERVDGNGYLRPVDDFVVKARSDVVQLERGRPGDTDRTRDLLEYKASRPSPRKEPRQSCSRTNARSSQDCTAIPLPQFVAASDTHQSNSRQYQNDMTGNTRPPVCHRYRHPGNDIHHSSSPDRDKSPYSLAICKNFEVRPDHVCLSHKIGGGAFGQVWKAVALDLDAGQEGWSPVAIKMLNEKPSRIDRKDLLSELEMLKKLPDHPNVIKFKGCVTRTSMSCGDKVFEPPFVILELVPYGDLLGYLRTSVGESDEQLAGFAVDIARGMEFLTAHQYVHRDLAARNVLIGAGLRCKVTDFGMARNLGKKEIYIRKSNGRVPLKWLAIESLTMQVYTTESDVWSFGVVLYEIFTYGGTPYPDMTGEEVFSLISSGNRMKKPECISKEIYNVMLSCWEEDSKFRPSFSSLATYIERLAIQQQDRGMTRVYTKRICAKTGETYC